MNGPTDRESLIARIQQVENERDELRKDIEQLCTQQGGPSYIFLATRMHLQRTAGLEQQIEKLQKELADCSRDKVNLKEELSEASRIKAQMEKHYRAAVAKNLGAEQQLKFFQESVASAYADRDQASMEAEEAKEKAELLQQELMNCQQRLKKSTEDALKAEADVTRLGADLAQLAHDTESFRKVVDKFFNIRQQFLGALGDQECTYDEKSSYLLQDPVDTWSFCAHKETINALEKERDTLKTRIVHLRQKLQVGLEIESHLKRKIREVENKKKWPAELIINRISSLRQLHLQERDSIMMILEEGKSCLMSFIDTFEKQYRAVDCVEEHLRLQHRSKISEDSEGHSPNGICSLSAERKPLDVTFDEGCGASISNATESSERSEALSQALHEKVSALLLLQQQEERHFLEKNVNAALLERLNELQACLTQVTKEKLEALVKLEYLERQFLKGGSCDEKRQDKPLATASSREGRLKSILKKTNFRRWISTEEYHQPEAVSTSSSEGYFFFRRSSNNMDAARLRIENATLSESLRCLEHLIFGIHKLRLDLVKAKEAFGSKASSIGVARSLDDIINEANLVKTALGSSIPRSWPAQEQECEKGVVATHSDVWEDDKVDTVSNAGFEMVELLVFAALIMKDGISQPAAGT